MIAHFILLLGCLSFLIASLGLFRMPDSFCRIHAATKASSLGIGLCTIAAVIEFQTPSSVILAITIVTLVFLTAPMACHAITLRLLPTTSKKNNTPPRK